MKIIKLTNNPSPKGFGYNAHTLKINTHMIGRNGKMWIVKNYNGIHRWVISDFYKEYKKAEKKLLNLFNKSIVKLRKYIPYETIIQKNNYENNDIVDYEESNFIFENKLSFLIKYEFNRLACKSGYFKYIINTGNDYFINKNKIAEISYFYMINNTCKIWKDFNKECKIYMKNAQKDIMANKDFINSLTEKEKKYIMKNYNIIL
jgi:hypothetical protein